MRRRITVVGLCIDNRGGATSTKETLFHVPNIVSAYLLPKNMGEDAPIHMYFSQYRRAGNFPILKLLHRACGDLYCPWRKLIPRNIYAIQEYINGFGEIFLPQINRTYL